MFPKLIGSGEWFLPSYGVLVALAFLAALAVTTRLARRAGLDSDKVTNLAIYCALAGIAGAKLLLVLFDYQHYLENPGDLLSRSTLQSAGVYQGGLALAIVVAFTYMRRVGLPRWATVDCFAPGIALGHAIGRLGCLLAGCCWGVACDRRWAITFTNPDAHDLTGVPLGIPLHPTQLYESLSELALFVLLWRFALRPHRPGQVLAAYLVLNGVTRFVIEFYREHQQALPFGGPLSLTQWISLLLLLAGLWLWRARTGEVTGQPAAAAAARTPR